METSHAPQVLQELPTLVKGSSDEGQQGELACLFDRGGHHTLVTGAGTGLAARTDLSVFGDVAAQQVSLLIVDCQGLVCAKLTGFGLRKEAALSAAFLGPLLWSSIFSHLLLQFLTVEIRHAW
jgi:hypothetical protein